MNNIIINPLKKQEIFNSDIKEIEIPVSTEVSEQCCPHCKNKTSHVTQ